MFIESFKHDAIIGFALTTAKKIEAEAQHREPNLRRLVLLSNTYDECASRAMGKMEHQEDDLLFPIDEDNDEDAANPPPASSTSDDSSSEEEWDSDNPDCEIEDAPPAYSLYETSSDVSISVSEYCSDDSDDEGLLSPELDAKSSCCSSMSMIEDISKASQEVSVEQYRPVSSKASLGSRTARLFRAFQAAAA
jgi:hypothetical protein